MVTIAAPFLTYRVVFGSDPDLPMIPSGAINLQPKPATEDGKPDGVGSTLDPTGKVVDQFSIVSDTNGIPEASTWAMMLIGFAGLGLAGYRRRRNSAAAA